MHLIMHLLFTSRIIKNQKQNQTLELSIVLSIGHNGGFISNPIHQETVWSRRDMCGMGVKSVMKVHTRVNSYRLACLWKWKEIELCDSTY